MSAAPEETRNSPVKDIGSSADYSYSDTDFRDEAEPLDMLKWELTALKLGRELEARQQKKEETSWERVNKVKSALAEEIEVRKKQRPESRGNSPVPFHGRQSNGRLGQNEDFPIPATQSVDVSIKRGSQHREHYHHEYHSYASSLPPHPHQHTKPQPQPPSQYLSAQNSLYQYRETRRMSAYPVKRAISPCQNSSIVKSAYQSGRINASFSEEYEATKDVQHTDTKLSTVFEHMDADELEAEYARLLSRKQNQPLLSLQDPSDAADNSRGRKMSQSEFDTLVEQRDRLDLIRRTSMNNAETEGGQKSAQAIILEKIKNMESRIIIHLEEFQESDEESPDMEDRETMIAQRVRNSSPSIKEVLDRLSTDFSKKETAVTDVSNNNKETVTREKMEEDATHEDLPFLKDGRINIDVNAIEKLVSGYFEKGGNDVKAKATEMAEFSTKVFEKASFTTGGCCMSLS